MNNQVATELLELVNQERNSSGSQPLTWSNQLADAAQTHSESMLTDDFFGHTNPTNGSQAGDRIDDSGYEWSRYGENVAAGYTTAQSVFDAWMGSPGHRANILNPDFTEIGVAHEFSGDDTGSVNYNHYWTQVFATPQFDNQNSLQNNAPANDSSLVNEIATLINQKRAEAGLDSLQIDEQLSQVAEEHSRSMAINDFVSSNGLDGSLTERVNQSGYEWSILGENNVVNSDDPEAIVNYLVTGSGGNSQNIFNPNFEDIGVGYEFLANDTGSVNYNHYVTIDFGSPDI